MKFLRINMENQFVPSNLNPSINRASDDSDSESEYEIESDVNSRNSTDPDGNISFRPMPRAERKNLNGKMGFQAIHIESTHVNDFKIPTRPPPQPQPELRDSKNVEQTRPAHSVTNVDVEVIRREPERVPLVQKRSEIDYSRFNYDNVKLKPQTRLLWSGPHWQIEKLLMDIAFSNDIFVGADESGDVVTRTVLLNSGQDGSFKEYISRKQRKVTEIQYNYPDQSVDDSSSIAFLLKKVGQLYYIVIVITDFTVTLDLPVNPERFCVNYLKRVLHTGGKFTIDK